MSSTNKIYIRGLDAPDLYLFKHMRLKALEAHPGVYQGKYEESLQRPDSEWLEMLDGKGKKIFGLFDSEQIIGLTAIFTMRDDPTGETAVLAMSYIEPTYRGRGLSKLLYQARIDWAIQHKPFKKITVGHREENEASKRAMIAHGFKLLDRKMTNWPDGTESYEYNYFLDLENLRN